MEAELRERELRDREGMADLFSMNAQTPHRSIKKLGQLKVLSVDEVLVNRPVPTAEECEAARLSLTSSHIKKKLRISIG